MRPTIAKTAAILIAAALIMAASRRPAIPYNEVQDRTISGRLERSLGLACTITGVAEKIEQREKDDGPDAVLIKIEAVDGLALAAPVVLDSDRDVVGWEKKPKSGEKFTLVAYETGFFVGPIDDPHKLMSHAKDELARQEILYPHYHLELRLNIVPERKT